MKIKWIRNTGWAIILIFMAMAALGTILGFLGHLSPYLELASNLRLQYLVISGAGAFIALGVKKYKMAGAAGLLTVVNLLLIAPLYFAPAATAPPSNAIRYRALLLNVDRRSQAYQQVINLIEETQPDFIVFLEPTPAWMLALQELKQNYPFTHSAIRPDPGSIALFSRIPLTQTEVLDFGVPERPVIVAQMDLNGQPLTVLGLHPYPFAARGVIKTQERQRQLDGLAQFAATHPRPVLALADLNFSPWSPLYRELLDQSGLRDARQGFGVQVTWPTNYPYLYMPIDYGLVSPEVVIFNHQIGPHVGSDHLPVVIDFGLSQHQ